MKLVILLHWSFFVTHNGFLKYFGKLSQVFYHPLNTDTQNESGKERRIKHVLGNWTRESDDAI